MDRVLWLPQVASNWQGPISLAVYVTSLKEWIGMNILFDFYRKCNPLFRDFVSIHVAIPIKAQDMSFIPDNSLFEREVDDFLMSNKDISGCNSTEKFTEAVIERFKTHENENEVMLYYPQNHMRNIAKKVKTSKKTNLNFV
jgi:hypothetical protein